MVHFKCLGDHCLHFNYVFKGELTQLLMLCVCIYMCIFACACVYMSYYCAVHVYTNY